MFQGRHIIQVYITYSRPSVPAKHRNNGFLEFARIGFVNTTRINPEIAEIMLQGLSSTEFDFGIASLVLSGTCSDVLESDLFRFKAPCMR